MGKYMTPESVSAVVDTIKGTVLPNERLAMFNKACAIDPHDTVVIEELSELIKAVSKINRCHNNEHLKSLMEEIADVRIVIERIMRKYNIKEDDIDKLVVFKINRFIDQYGI
jgi:NTP pyrophosphatase (non-canonical NTP hydrolase)